MNPWNIIGWAIIGFSVAAVVLVIFTAVSKWLAMMWRHIKTRHIIPALGQTWIEDGDTRLHITHITPATASKDMIIHVKCGPVSWGDTLSRWRKRVKVRKLYLLK